MRGKRQTIVLMAAFLSLTIFLPTSTTPAPKENSVTIGQSEPLTGPLASLGIANDRMMRLVVEEINNAGGFKVKGVPYKFKVICEDNKATAEGAVAAANKLIYKDGVKFVVFFPTPATVSSQLVTEPAKVLNLAHGGAPELLGPQKPYTFRHFATSSEVAPVMIKWIIKNKPEVKSSWMTQAEGASGRAIINPWNAACTKYGIKVLGSDYVAREVSDFYPLLSKILAQNPGVIGATSGDQGALFLKQARELGYKGLFAVPLPLSETYIKIGGAANVEGAIHTAPDPESELTPKHLRELFKAYVRKYGEQPTGHVWWVVIPPYILAQAMQRADTVDDVEKIKAVMEKEWFETPWGKVKFGGEKIYGVPHQLMLPVFISTIADGRVKILERIDPPEVDKILSE